MKKIKLRILLILIITILILTTAGIAISGESRFSKDKNGIIVDYSTGLEWYVGNSPRTWDEARVWAATLKLAGGGCVFRPFKN